MQDEQRFNLLFGPYHPPKTRRGKFLFCEMRGTVKVGDYSDGPIPWPVKWGTRNSLILCGDLVRAVQVESAQGVAHHWVCALPPSRDTARFQSIRAVGTCDFGAGPDLANNTF